MTETKKQEGYNGIYLERAGKDTLKLTELLVAEPQYPLDEAEAKEVHDFEESLYNHGLSDGLTIESLIKTRKAEEVTAPSFFADAFISGKVNIDNIGVEVPLFSTSDEVYAWIATLVKNNSVEPATLLKMARESRQYYIDVIAEALVTDQTPSPTVLDTMPIVVDPAQAMKIAADSAEAREFLVELRRIYKEGGEKVDGAKRAFVDIYLGRINTMITSDIVMVDYLMDQSKLIDDTEMWAAAEGLIPGGLRSALGSPKTQTMLFKRFDYLRNGMGLDQNGHASALEQAVIDENNREAVLNTHENPMFTPEERDKLKSFMLDSDQIGTIVSRILARARLLSSEPPETWSPTRSSRAADGLFQAVKHPTKNEFEVDGISGTYKYPHGERSLYDLIVVGLFHEFQHVNDVQADLEMAKNIHIAALKGRRVSMFRESAANAKQREGQRILFGESKPILLTYARALQVLEAGGDTYAASQASYKEHLRAMPNEDPKKAAKQAASRVLRLTLQGGFNSQPLAYAEESILNYELRDASPTIKKRATAIRCLDLVDQVRLHRYGLLSEVDDTAIDWQDIGLEELAPYINEALKRVA